MPPLMTTSPRSASVAPSRDPARQRVQASARDLGGDDRDREVLLEPHVPVDVFGAEWIFVPVVAERPRWRSRRREPLCTSRPTPSRASGSSRCRRQRAPRRRFRCPPGSTPAPAGRLRACAVVASADAACTRRSRARGRPALLRRRSRCSDAPTTRSTTAPPCGRTRAVDAPAGPRPCPRCPTARCRRSPARSGRTCGLAARNSCQIAPMPSGSRPTSSCLTATEELRGDVDAGPGDEHVAVDALVGRDRDHVDPRGRRTHAGGMTRSCSSTRTSVIFTIEMIPLVPVRPRRYTRAVTVGTASVYNPTATRSSFRGDRRRT